jgi:F0F1-type ATP synthase delta subunit
MKIPRTQIAAAISKLSLDSTTAFLRKRLAEEVAAYLLIEHRTDELDSLMRDVMEERSRLGVVEVVAVSAHHLASSVIDDLKQAVKELFPGARQIIISPKLDPSLIGGIRLEFANRQLDLSVRAKLNQLKQLIAYRKDQVGV